MINLSELDLYLIRHANPIWKSGFWSTPDTNLSELGIEQAERLGTTLSSEDFDMIYSSPYIRALQTAKAIKTNSEKNLNIKICSWLAEINIGGLHGLNHAEVKKLYPECDIPAFNSSYKQEGPLVSRLLAYNKNFIFPGGESVKSFWDRVRIGLSNLLTDLNNNQYTKTALVGHGGSLTIILLILLGYQVSDQTLPRFRFEEANPTVLKIRKENIMILKIN